jgi:hypothetical protein
MVRNQAIKKICTVLESDNLFDLEGSLALDFFAREGDWQTKYIAEKVHQIHAWEVNPLFEKELRKNLPQGSQIVIGNSFEMASQKQNIFDVLIFDNPQGCYGPANQYCEHFDALPLIPNLIKPEGGLIIFNVKLEPFDYESKTLWQRRRNLFFGVKDASKLTTEFAQTFYNDFFCQMAYKVEFSFLVPRPQETGLYSMVTRIRSL